MVKTSKEISEQRRRGRGLQCVTLNASCTQAHKGFEKGEEETRGSPIRQAGATEAVQAALRGIERAGSGSRTDDPDLSLS